jgi:hypothetical protein
VHTKSKLERKEEEIKRGWQQEGKSGQKDAPDLCREGKDKAPASPLWDRVTHFPRFAATET